MRLVLCTDFSNSAADLHISAAPGCIRLSCTRAPRCDIGKTIKCARATASLTQSHRTTTTLLKSVEKTGIKHVAYLSTHRENIFL